MHFFTREKPLAINIASRDIGTIVSIDDSIHINHRYNFYQKLVPQLDYFGSVGKQSFDDSFKDKRSRGFSRMLSPNYVNYRLMHAMKNIIGNVQHKNLISEIGFTKETFVNNSI